MNFSQISLVETGTRTGNTKQSNTAASDHLDCSAGTELSAFSNSTLVLLSSIDGEKEVKDSRGYMLTIEVRGVVNVGK